MNTPLSWQNLPAIGSGVGKPAYRPQDLDAGILHFGIGNFHRAHQAVYLDDLFSRGIDHDWAIIGASVRQADADIRRKLQSQDWLSTVVERDATSQVAKITGVMIDYIVPGDTAGILEQLRDPAIRIVSMTITEGGYFIDPATGTFDPNHPEIVADAENIAAPKTVFGLILAGLIFRREAGLAPFTVMSCDNIPGNGHVTRDAVAGLAGRIDPALADWVRAEIAFPNSMVDRITPATSEREISMVAADYGIDDAWPVACETFRQWVVEDHFPTGRPALEKVGVTFVADVEPFELMKIRILNGGHAAIAYPAGLMDIHFVHEAMQDPLISAYLRKLETEEILPVVPPVPNTDLDGYLTRVIERFANPTVADTVRRLCLDGSNRQPKFILPSARDRMKAGGPVLGLALVSALWCRYCAGTTDSGAPIASNDPAWERLQARALMARNDPAAFLSMTDIFGELAGLPRYVEPFSHALQTVWSIGTRATLERYLAGTL